MASQNLKTASATAALLLTLGLGAAAPAGANDTYTPSGEISVSNPTPKAGQSITLSGKTTPDTLVTITMAKGASSQSLIANAATTLTLGSTMSDGNGDYSLSVTVPADAAAGSWVMSAMANGAVLSSSNLTVAAPAAATTNPGTTQNPGQATLPVTGSESAPTAAIALAIIGFGGSMVLLEQKTRDDRKTRRSNS